jgi:ABC-type dipeptide/oligopeptide/nickel transport system permease subunit
MADNPKTTVTTADAMGAAAAPPRHSEWRRIARVFFGRKLYAIGFVICVILILVAIFAPWIATHDPLKTDLRHKLEQPNWTHLLGTDSVGRDTFSRIVYGTRTSLLIGFTAVFASAIVGTLMGLAAAYFGGWVFAIIMRFTDALMALPGIILVLLIAGLVGGGIPVVIFALGFGGIAGMCRMMCGQALSVKQNDYVLAGRAIGMSDWRMMLTQIFPNAFPPLMVGITMGIGGVVLGEAGLSFLGIGVMPPTPSWGGMVNNGQSYLLTNPILSLAPGVAIMLLVFGFNMLGDGVRDAVDPKLRGVL